MASLCVDLKLYSSDKKWKGICNVLTFLRNLVELVTNIPQYILFAIESVINLFFSAVEGIWLLAVSLIPLPAVPGPPEFITAINWFFPIGAIISIATPIVAGYIAFLLIRWIYKWAGAL
jgi:hypothetical protein